jgi:hypothetical protein
MLSLSLNRHLSCEMFIQVANAVVAINNNNNTNDTLSEPLIDVQWTVQSVRLDKLMGLCCSMACCFGILYVLVVRANEEYCFLHHGDDESAVTMIEGGGTDAGVQSLELSRLDFWALIFTHAYVVSLVGSTAAHDMEHLQIQVICRCAAVWVLCRTGRSMRGKAPMLLGLCVYVYWAFSTAQISSINKNSGKSVFLTFQIVLDVLLFVGHRWDGHTCALVALNCRLFYVAGVSTMLFSLLVAG